MWQIISTYISILIMTFGIYLFGKIVLNSSIKISYIRFIIIMLVFCGLHTVFYLNFFGTIKTILVCIINIFLYYFIFKISLRKSSILTFSYLVLLILLELLELFIITEILHMNTAVFLNTKIGIILSNLYISASLVIISYILRKILRIIINTEIENNTKIIVFSILAFICIGMFFYTIIKEFEFNNEVLLYLCAIIILLIVLFSLIKQTIENNKLTEQYDKLLEFMKQYEQEAENQRILRHETKNEFLAIKAKLYDKQKNKEVIEYIDEILQDKIELKQEEFAKFVYLPANGIKGLCYFKTQEAKDKGLNTCINISKRIENSNIYKLNIKEQRDLGKILGVFLDNAIEASINSKAKEFGIEAYLNIKKECEIIISNSYDGEIDTDKIGKEKFSTKGKNRGHGLLLVNHLVSKNDKFFINTKITNGLYIQTLTIKKTKK